mmetsp:Transcript_5105/g.11254  ORF Transcript_5105/g.11254 Transcript_5105/m.11254 type:complete len:216 (+) Transcript_5105:208-855(+)
MCSVSSLVSDFASPIWTMRVRRSPMRASQIRRRSSSSRRSLSHSVGRPQNGSMAHCRASSMPHMRRSLASRSSSSTFRSAASFARFLAASASSSAVLRSLARFIFASSFNRARSSNLRWCASRSLSSRRLLASSMSCTCFRHSSHCCVQPCCFAPSIALSRMSWRRRETFSRCLPSLCHAEFSFRVSSSWYTAVPNSAAAAAAVRGKPSSDHSAR